MKPVSDLTVCVVDHGLFLPVAQRLARDCKKVYYSTETERAFPTVQDIVGDGFTDVERVDSLWRVHDRVDLFVFPDVGFGPLQKHLVDDNHPVFGAMEGSTIETNRGKFLRTLREVGLSVPPFKALRGMDALKDYIWDREDVFIKVSNWRGDWETLHWRSRSLDEIELTIRAVRLGPWKDHLTFYVFDPIDTTIEDGCDSFCVDGQWPETCIHGMECKDKALIATFQKFSDLPEQLRVVNEAFRPVLAEYGYRSFFSTEVRITEQGEGFFIDPTCRAGSPPSQVQAEMIANYSEMIWAAANGQVIEPEPAAKFGVQAVLKIPGNEGEWRILTLDEELEPWVKASMCSRVEDRLVFAPGTHEEVCWLTATGNTIEETIDALKERVELLPDGVCCPCEALSELIEEIHEAEEKGMEFTDQPVPDASIVQETQ